MFYHTVLNIFNAHDSMPFLPAPLSGQAGRLPLSPRSRARAGSFLPLLHNKHLVLELDMNIVPKFKTSSLFSVIEVSVLISPAELVFILELDRN